jgi:hypothetical protein
VRFGNGGNNRLIMLAVKAPGINKRPSATAFAMRRPMVLVWEEHWP